MLFTLRAHNDVNRRLNKPLYLTVASCFERLRKNVQFNTARSFRITYINHITRHWRSFQDASGLAAMKKIHQMKKIEDSYMTPRTNEFEIIIPEDVVIVQLGPQEIPTARPILQAGSGSRMMMTPFGLRLRK